MIAGSRIELKIKAAIRAEPIDDNNPAFANLQVSLNGILRMKISPQYILCGKMS